MTLPDARLVRYWRRALAVLLALDAFWIAGGTAVKVAADTDALAPDRPWFASLSQSLPLMLLVAGVVAFASWRFGRRAGAPLWGLLAVAATWPLIEAHGFAHRDYTRSSFYPGGMTLGWVFGYAFTAALQRWGRSSNGQPADAQAQLDARERLAGIGAIALLATPYISAGISKFLFTANGWVNPAILRLSVIMENRAPAEEWTTAAERFVIDNPNIAMELAVATIIIECGAIVFAFGPRLRALSASSLLAFHAGSIVLLDVIFLEAIVCLAVFGYPWPSLVRKSRAKDQEPAEAGDGAVRLPARAGLGRALGLAGVVMAAVAVVWVAPIGQAAHTPGAGPAAPVTRGLGPFSVSTEVVPGWTLTKVDVQPAFARLTLEGPDDAAVDVLLGTPESSVRPGPFDVWPARMAYQGTTLPWEELKPMLDRLAASIRAEFARTDLTAGGSALQTWLDAAQ